MVLAERSLFARPSLYFADTDCAQHGADAAHDAAGGYGSRATADDEPDDAGNARVFQLVGGLGAGTVLGDRNGGQHCAAMGDEPHRTGAGDSRRSGEARTEGASQEVAEENARVSIQNWFPMPLTDKIAAAKQISE